MQKHAIADATAVAVKMEPASIPEALKMDGLSARMYTIVINVVIPAITSVLTVVPFSFK